MTLKLYVWRGPEVLKNYRSGVVVVAAETPELAWVKLRDESFRAWFWLRTGIAYVFSPDEVDSLDDYERPPIEPEEFTLDTFPVIVKEGGG